MEIRATVISKKTNVFFSHGLVPKVANMIIACCLFWCFTLQKTSAQSSRATTAVPDWALPGSATHHQVPPPPDFHRETVTVLKPIGIFEGQSEVGAALAPGSSGYNSVTKQYTINAAGYNVWYTRDEFRYLWKKMNGDVSLAADVSFPDTTGYSDRKAMVIIRQSLDDDAKEAMVALHGAGLMHLAWRPEKGENIKEMRVDIQSLTGSKELVHAKRIGIEKHGDDFAVFVSLKGEPMHQYGAPIHLHIDGPFYVGIGFCAHQPDKISTTILSNVVLENMAGKVW